MSTAERTNHSSVAEHLRFVGVDGLRRASTQWRFDAFLPAAFRMDLHLFQADRSALRYVRATPHRAERGPAEMRAHPDDSVVLSCVLAGRFRADYGSRTQEVAAGRMTLHRGDSPVYYDADEPLELLSVVLPRAALSPGAADPDRLPAGVLPETRLLAAVRSVAQTLVAGPPTEDIAEARLLVHSMTDLAVTALSASVVCGDASSDRFRLRQRILAHIDRRLDDPGLGPASIARDFSISLRYLHLLFQDEEATVARTIRDRRLDAVEHFVQRRPGILSTEQLRVRFGFTSADQLTRGFRARFGRSLRDGR